MGKSLILGFFDGVHAAHRAVISSAINFSSDSLLITFKNSPAKFFNKEYEYILPREESLKKIKTLGVKEVLELDFDKIAKMSAQAYLDFLHDEFAPASISTGFNHTFGRNRIGNPEFLAQNQEKYGYKYFCVPPQLSDGDVISSTLIKRLLKGGNIERANNLLETKFLLEGVVTKGTQIGEKIGFPTANISYPEHIVKIPFGVYCVEVLGYKGVMNWGIKPTVHNVTEPVAETHIIGFDGDLYGKTLKIEIINKIRDEQKFGNLEELKTQINKDIETCLKL